MKDLMQQPFYNFFISQIDTIKEDLEQANITIFPILLKLIALQQKLSMEDYAPFADYPDMLQQLNPTPIIVELMHSIFRLPYEQNSEAAIAMQFIMQNLDELKAYAHFLNFLECHYVSSELGRKQVNTLY